MRRETERTNKQRHVDDAATDAEEARHEADDRAVDDTAAHRHGVGVGGAVAIDEETLAETAARLVPVTRLTDQQPDSEAEQADRHQEIEQFT